ncbi:MAG: hypothetical protein Q8P13_03290 [bacterium]|nr:hypothetical protein [bacterium]
MLSRLFAALLVLVLFFTALSSWMEKLASSSVVEKPAKISGVIKKPILPTKILFKSSQDSELYTPVQKQNSGSYPLHRNIVATYFYVGELAGPDNDFISNTKSAWDGAWEKHFGGVDDPAHRNGYWPAGFKPKENPFYFALPYGEFDEVGLKANAKTVYWYDKNLPLGKSLLKNRWVKISRAGKVCYAQWEDVGPNDSDDVNYVFGSAKSKNTFGLRAGIDLSPAVRDFLDLGDSGKVSWQFVNDADVPPGPWKQIVTTSNPSW